MVKLEFSNIRDVQYMAHDLRRMLRYFRDSLGMPLMSIDWVDEDRQIVRAVLGLSDGSSLAFLWSPEVSGELHLGTAHPTDPSQTNTRGTMQHIAFNARTLDDLYALRDRIRASGVLCSGPIDHGFCHSIYFAGPEGLSLEVATHNDVEHHEWIEPSVEEELKISGEEMHRLRNPDVYESPSEPVKNPPLEASTEYRLAWSDERYSEIHKNDSDPLCV